MISATTGITPQPLPPSTQPAPITATPLARVQYDVSFGHSMFGELPDVPLKNAGSPSHHFTLYAGPLMDADTSKRIQVANRQYDRSKDLNEYRDAIRAIWDPSKFTTRIEGTLDDALRAARELADRTRAGDDSQSIAVSQVDAGSYLVQPLAHMRSLDGQPHFLETSVGAFGIKLEPASYNGLELSLLHKVDPSLRAIVNTSSWIDMTEVPIAPALPAPSPTAEAL